MTGDTTTSMHARDKHDHRALVIGHRIQVEIAVTVNIFLHLSSSWFLARASAESPINHLGCPSIVCPL